MAVTSLQLHCCLLLLNLNGFDLAVQIILVCFSLPGQRGRTSVRCRACRIHKQLHGKKDSQTEGGGSEGNSPAAGVDGGDDSGNTVASGSGGGGGGGGGGSPAAGAGGR